MEQVYFPFLTSKTSKLWLWNSCKIFIFPWKRLGKVAISHKFVVFEVRNDKSTCYDKNQAFYRSLSGTLHFPIFFEAHCSLKKIQRLLKFSNILKCGTCFIIIKLDSHSHLCTIKSVLTDYPLDSDDGSKLLLPFPSIY